MSVIFVWVWNDISNRPSIFEWFLFDAQWFSQIFTDCHWLNRYFQWFIFVRVAFEVFLFYDTLNYGMACIRLLGSYIQSCVQVFLAGKWYCMFLFKFDGRDTPRLFIYAYSFFSLLISFFKFIQFSHSF